jgi:ubiquinone/menaquinone biosynthesis C-methylase UbiE
MLGILGSVGVRTDALKRVLDFGCAEGRMLRFFPRTDENELWGVDVNAERISWAQQNLAPPLRFITTTTAPHLPFEDNYFDLVYCSSVFTHISDLTDAWFLELRRVLRKGGYAYITIHDRHTVEWLFAKDKNREGWAGLRDLVRHFDEQTSVLSQNYATFSIGTDPASQVFYDADCLLRRWSRLAKVLSVTPEAHDHQTALLLQKEPVAGV